MKLLTVLFLYLVNILYVGYSVEGPNIIIIYADDVGYGDLGCYGATGVDTPNLDRLARNGIRFTSAYATASTCTPSRYSLLTGEYPFRNKKAVILPGNAPLIIDLEKPTIASVLKSVGYTTGLVGKWHLGLGPSDQALDWNGEITPGPKELGFDYSFHMAATGDRVPTVYIENGRIVGLDRSDPVSVSYDEPIGSEPTGISHPHLLKTQADEQHAKTIVDGTSRIGYMTGGQSARWRDEEMPDTFLGKALDFIKKNQTEPFFLFYATHENHVPRLPHPRFKDSSSLGVRGDAIVQMDWGVGRILETLQNLGIANDTLVIFSSDNGPVLYDGYYDGAVEQNGDHLPAGPWSGGKYSAREGGGRMPFIVSWPSKIKPALTDGIISQVDLFASIAALTEAEMEEGQAQDSQNLLDLLVGESEVGREHVVVQGASIKSIRMGDWKYFPKGRNTERKTIDRWHREQISAPGALYYLPEDPQEQNNLVKVYPEKAKLLKEQLEKELGETSLEHARAYLGGAKVEN
ncbi:MAG: arylsulfatase [Opitutales bacterium]|nr:arylsulfatase [Opitutales bacterium]